MQSKHIRHATAAVLLAGLVGAAQAHTGHGTSSFMQGLVHPFGLDHLLAMVAVGVWSVATLPHDKVWQGPTTFLLALVISAMLGTAGITMPYLEHAIALSVVLFGLLLVVVQRGLLVPLSLGLGLIAVASSLHGLAHGAETPETGFAGYATGFLLTTAVLHVSGIGLGLAIQRWLGERRGTVLGGLGAAVGVAGLYLFGQLAV